MLRRNPRGGDGRGHARPAAPVRAARAGDCSAAPAQTRRRQPGRARGSPGTGRHGLPRGVGVGRRRIGRWTAPPVPTVPAAAPATQRRASVGAERARTAGWRTWSAGTGAGTAGASVAISARRKWSGTPGRMGVATGALGGPGHRRCARPVPDPALVRRRAEQRARRGRPRRGPAGRASAPRQPAAAPAVRIGRGVGLERVIWGRASGFLSSRRLYASSPGVGCETWASVACWHASARFSRPFLLAALVLSATALGTCNQGFHRRLPGRGQATSWASCSSPGPRWRPSAPEALAGQHRGDCGRGSLSAAGPRPVHPVENDGLEVTRAVGVPRGPADAADPAGVPGAAPRGPSPRRPPPGARAAPSSAARASSRPGAGAARPHAGGLGGRRALPPPRRRAHLHRGATTWPSSSACSSSVARFRQLVGIVTAFTVAHSVTLALATLGWVVPPPRLIEPLIALSIVAVAVENLWALRPPLDGRPGAGHPSAAAGASPSHSG